MRTNIGYEGNSNDTPAGVAAYGATHGIPLTVDQPIQGTNDALIDLYLDQGNPVILDVGGHFVIVTGRTTVNGVETYAIRDPGHRDRSDLHTLYRDQYFGARLYSSG